MEIELTIRCCFPEHFEILIAIFGAKIHEVMDFLISNYILPFLYLLIIGKLFWPNNSTKGTKR